jgi:hypothetical protein
VKIGDEAIAATGDGHDDAMAILGIAQRFTQG